MLAVLALLLVRLLIISGAVDRFLEKREEARIKKDVAEMTKLLDGSLLEKAYYNTMCEGSCIVNGLTLKERTMAEYKRLKEEAV